MSWNSEDSTSSSLSWYTWPNLLQFHLWKHQSLRKEKKKVEKCIYKFDETLIKDTKNKTLKKYFKEKFDFSENILLILLHEKDEQSPSYII